MQLLSAQNTIPRDTALARFPCPPQFRQEFGYMYVTLVRTAEGEYAIVDSHRTSHRVSLDEGALETLSPLVRITPESETPPAAAAA